MVANANFWKNKRVAITGHTGFKGSWLSLWLLKMGAKVSGISLEPEYSKNHFNSLEIKGEINHIICDIRDRDNLKQHLNNINPEIIFHLAAQVAMSKSILDPELDFDINVNGTLNILNAIVNENSTSIFDPKSLKILLKIY